jgi:hypothetical protein
MRSSGTKDAVSRTLLAAVFLLSAAPLRAIGLRTKFGQVTVRGLKIGQEYSLNNLLNLPLRILNTGDLPEDIRIDLNPQKNAGTPGYEPIPDVSWVTLDQHDFTVEGHHEAVTDIHIKIPNDPKLLGRRFEAHIWSRTVPKHHSMYGAGLGSVLLFEVSSVPPTEDELKAKYVDKHLANMDFTLFPTEGNVEDVPVGEDFNLKKERKVSIKLVNPNDAKLTFKIRAIPFWESLLTPPDGYDVPPQYTWVRPSTDTVSIEPDSIKDTALFANIPNNDDFKGKAYVFVLSVEVLEQEISARIFYELLLKTRAK